MVYSLIFIFLLYLAWIVFLWKGLKSRSPKSQAAPGLISVIVAARNEENRLPELLLALEKQTLSQSKFEIVVVDDRSTDGTPRVLAAWQKRLPNLRTQRVDAVPPQMPPKKFALSQGIAASRGELLFFTDADCRPEPRWLKRASRFFTPETDAVVGLTHLRPEGHGLLGRLLEIESLFNSTVARAGLAAGIPLTATAANLAYRRRVYDAVGGFAPISHSVSGDDDLFLQLIHRELGAKIHFATDPAVRVETDPPESWRAFFRQRLRHLSAGKYYSLPAKVIYAFFHLSQSLLLLFPLGFFSAHWAVYFVSFFILKGALDVLLFKSIQTTYGVSFSLPLALLWEYFYLAETWLIGPLSWIVPVGWKDSVQPVGDHAH